MAVEVSRWLAHHDVDLISVSAGGNVSGAPIPAGPGYQVPFATRIKHEAGIPVAAVGMIDQPFQAEQIVVLDQADVVLVGRESLRDPNFPIRAAQALRHDLAYRPVQYERAYR